MTEVGLRKTRQLHSWSQKTQALPCNILFLLQKEGADTTASACFQYLEDDKFKSSGELGEQEESVALWIQSAKAAPSPTALPPRSLHHQIK